MVTASETPTAGFSTWIRPRAATLVVFLYLLLTVLVLIVTPVQFLRIGQSSLPFALSKFHFFIIPYLAGLVYLICGTYVFFARHYDRIGRAFSLFAASAAIVLAETFNLSITHRLALPWTISAAIAGMALVDLAMLFPERIPLSLRYPLLSWLGYGCAILLGLAAMPAIRLDPADPYFPGVGGWLLILFFSTCLLFFMIVIARRRTSAISTIVREQSNLILLGAFLAFAPIIVWSIVHLIFPKIVYSPLYLLSTGFLPVFAGYAVVRYRLLRTEFIISQAALYAILAGLAMAAYALLVGGLSLIIGRVVNPANPLVIGMTVFLLTLGLNPVRTYLQNTIDRYFFRGQVVYREVQQAFGQELTRLMDLPEILDVLRRTVNDALNPAYLHIFVYDPLSARFFAAADSKGQPTSEIRFASGSPLVQYLTRQREALYIAEVGDTPAVLQPEAPRMGLLAAVLYVPLPGRRQLTGWLALGMRRSGEPYTNRDLSFLEALSNQVALAVERAQVVADLERRIREMNVLTRVAQGVSFTVAFDDILELISAQTNQVIPALDVRITLLDEVSGVLQHVFFIENDERLRERENRPLPLGQGLEQEVIHGQRAILTDDYDQECRRRSVLPNAPGIYAWMGVPLNAGAKTIGAMSIGSRDLGVVYTDEQRNLLQAIADQASGAIVKARSLEESERRAMQLAKLNEIGLGLTSTLDVKPLLQQILSSAADILECAAGSLFLVDPQTDELVFEVVLGPVADDLTGRRLPLGTGLVGQAVQSGRPVIANDAKRRKEWFEKTDEQTGFDTQDMLVVPMRIQDRMIGAIEVINKRNGAPFTQADQDLLTAFTSQATIAMENARLYTMTDQALAARVEELSVMQRIDRELNAGLDIERTMRLTLDWAMRQSHADAGLVGTVEGAGNVRVMVYHGYPASLFPTEPAAGEPEDLARRIPLVKDAIEKGLPGSRSITAPETGVSTEQAPNATTLLPTAEKQVVIPIRRETQTIGVLLLESAGAEPISEELINFLTRLSDHAAIAIANARLFEEVKEANLAKSRFVSFVAHELKNPMASIKGYTELVASGMAGAVNEMQASFLGTVRSNVDRMNTIVSDLNDLTKIQTGNLRLEYRAVKVHEVLDDVVRSLKRQVEEKNQNTSIHLPGDLPAVWADPSRLAQILTNLVSNAQKYTAEGKSFTVAAEASVVAEGALAGASQVHIWVSDEGIGISEDDQKKIFQQYFRTDNAKEMASGTGLGLSITKSLIELQGGRIWFESEIGKGTTFHFTLPVAEAQ